MTKYCPEKKLKRYFVYFCGWGVKETYGWYNTGEGREKRFLPLLNDTVAYIGGYMEGIWHVKS